jgi:hypothetical protein
MSYIHFYVFEVRIGLVRSQRDSWQQPDDQALRLVEFDQTIVRLPCEVRAIKSDVRLARRFGFPCQMNMGLRR